ncbi:DNA polymerase IV [Rubellimicrobium sp. CFH 75288]|uniref:DNA polymerase IV n=1 Tax=Rubellimicrobium sp. CFH 75288 TaxID=2697034 RepID=UPI001411DCD7|nr:DNA polymerase IV [Rubellimicrobium sp. CFH 75288]NAZ36328.1 DNA polymerase IV [Rubellimicrobium sp. CFH 75288]
MPALCRDCLERFDAPAGSRCPSCGSPRMLVHPRLWSFAIAHCDCDAFYAAVEKRDNPDLRDRPVIVGGGVRGVVSTACYLARLRGVRSAMPMVQAVRLCPEAAVVRPRFAAYEEASRAIRALMEGLTDRVEPLSLDEAFLDLRGTERVHAAPPALVLARFALAVEREVGVTLSIGLSENKFLAKLASDLDKPRGFAVLARDEAVERLSARPVSDLWGVGEAGRQALARAGIHRIRDLERWDIEALRTRFGSLGERLWHLARGEDARPVCRDRPIRSISHELTFEADLLDHDRLDGHLWRLSEKVSARAKTRGLAGRVVLLKLKRADHSLLTRRTTLREPTQMADTLYRTGRLLFDSVPEAGPFRLLGVGLGGICPAVDADRLGDLLDPDTARRRAAERAADAIRSRWGEAAIVKGRALR